MQINLQDGGSAFPCDSPTSPPTRRGMSLREWYAGQALAGLLAGEKYPVHNCAELTRWAGIYADTMIQERRDREPSSLKTED